MKARSKAVGDAEVFLSERPLDPGLYMFRNLGSSAGTALICLTTVHTVDDTVDGMTIEPGGAQAVEIDEPMYISIRPTDSQALTVVWTYVGRGGLV